MDWKNCVVKFIGSIIFVLPLYFALETIASPSTGPTTVQMSVLGSAVVSAIGLTIALCDFRKK